MTQRINFATVSPDIMKKFVDFVVASKQNAVEESIRDLVNVRIAQLNACTFSLDLYVKQSKLHGERELRLYHLAAWRESTLFSPRERASLAWAEIVTKLPELGVPDELYDRVRTQLSEKEISDLTFVVMAANAWTRVNSGFKTVPGSTDAMLGLDKTGLN
ncbi:carboxymuconolactone decarboxylase family protein [Rhizobium sp. 16-449-1b]|jgi:AhpD family alkylhydroperoxidase|uniref:carboxymuconolactone decarboxylase family protein n=1 Tax=Rhizobium sp. 16-449-1b TaxID=2819989 RepID=UPI000DDB66D0|nr:carboxymuconolactone decarboxylase family protein [Rhizobium sp. 16-449-1b]MBO9198189.1 carboxymuconolactone decarboxylase family protein [Rhizobium sp. 16-449-1b]